MFHANSFYSCGVITSFKKNPEIKNKPVWILTYTWPLGVVSDLNDCMQYMSGGSQIDCKGEKGFKGVLFFGVVYEKSFSIT